MAGVDRQGPAQDEWYPIAHGSLVVTQRVQLKRARFRENGFIEGKKRFQLCFVASYSAATSSLASAPNSAAVTRQRHFRDMRQGLGQESACQEGPLGTPLGGPFRAQQFL